MSSARPPPLLRSCGRERKAAAVSSNVNRGKRRRVAAKEAASSSESESPISDIADSLLIHILQRLPDPRSVCVCKSVCKHWNFLISEPDALRQLVSRHKVNLTGGSAVERLIHFDRPQTHESIFSPMPIVAAASYNDLLLCGRIRPKNRYGKQFFVCNPFTKQCVALPLIPRSLARYHGFHFGTHQHQGIEYDASLIGFACEPCFYNDDDDRSASTSTTTSSSSEVVTKQNFNFRFRVVFIFRGAGLAAVTFCSELWEWKFHYFRYMCLLFERPLLPSTSPCIGISDAQGKLFWKTSEAKVVVYDPFSDETRPFDFIDCSHLWSNDIVNNNFLIGVSQGVVRGMVFPRPGRARNEGFFSLWKLEEDQDGVGGYRWSLDYKVSMEVVYNIIVRRGKMNKVEGGGRRRMMRLGVLGVHPSRPEVIYFECRDHTKNHNHDPFFFDFRYHFRRSVDDGSLSPDDHNYDPIYAVPFDVLRSKVVGEIIPISESIATHLRFKSWGMFGIGDPIGWAVFQPVIPFWPTPIPAPDGANEVVEEEPEDIDESHLGELAYNLIIW